jgi:hypothetical protein
MINSQALWSEDAASAKIMEAEAICDATKLVVERDYQNMHIESDAQELVNILKEPLYCMSDIASISREITEIGASFSFQISYMGRHANQAAHSIASKISSVIRRCMWLNY